jgi:hypothetical protein
MEIVGLVDLAPVLFGQDTPLVQFGAPATAIIVGHDGALLALGVSSVGDIALVPPEAVATATAPTVPPAGARYVIGSYVPPSQENGYAIIEVARLTDDLLQALREAASHE